MSRLHFDKNTLSTPYYLIDQPKLEENLSVLKEVATRAGCKILLAQKAFSAFCCYPLIAEYLDGTAASGLFEAKLGSSKMGLETHTFSAAFRPDEFEEVLAVSDHIIFNSFSQWKRYREQALQHKKQCGLRINPMHSTGQTKIYDPCAEGSRLGIEISQFDGEDLKGVDGFHFHCLCEQNADALIETLAVVEKQFAKYFSQISWINFGGGHHITREDYDRQALIQCIQSFRHRYGLSVYLEPGEAVALNAGYLVCSVLDIVENHGKIAILDTSASCHMPDVIEMPYRPPLFGSGLPNEKKHTYRLAGPSCLAGDVMGDYSFDVPLQIGDRLVFLDMAIYSMVKNNTFNGIPLPSIALLDQDGACRIVKSFSYEDFLGRLS